MNRVPLFNEFRLIERSESDINGVWKGAHLLLFFLAFVFGSFCTFCFHMLMYLFDEKCVLFPKLLSLTSLRHNVIYEFIPSSKDLADMPVDFLSTQWVEKSTCSLPTYVPLVSGIFGLVWTTMFLMCSTGSRTLTGLQRPWRVLPPVFVFSLAMGGLCIYSSAVTHYGLQELCLKLGEITGSSTCTYTVNVATLTYERRIRGVYQATRLTILSAWLHTACWLLSALLALVRVLLAVDFQLVCVHVRLHGDVEKILEKDEVQIRTVSPDPFERDSFTDVYSKSLLRNIGDDDQGEITMLFDDSETVRHSDLLEEQISELSLVPDEKRKLVRLRAYKAVEKAHQFIVRDLYNLLYTMVIPESPIESVSMAGSLTSVVSSRSVGDISSRQISINRQVGRENVASQPKDVKPFESAQEDPTLDFPDEVEEIMKSESFVSLERMVRKVKEVFDFRKQRIEFEQPTTSRALESRSESVLNLSVEMRNLLDLDEEKLNQTKKSNLKTIGVQTDKSKKRKRSVRVKIADRDSSQPETETESDTSPDLKDEVDKETQTGPKEKQD
ncbi:uncharacterized protein LOC113506727 [Trichoplusia ni]|uniref:Uncharacterized protein LOC113504758 n=1 Tax=Trichoplusia ni TaxID=7111 RepID=A0A7E5WQG8_TRINI|nr:uncharacterized protein LOC113504758 [Trichoplusia ni]XP_026745358.1 uncharacterized protein LOC113506727 [Trichoplusia ni]